MSGTASQIRALIIAVEKYSKIKGFNRKLPGTHTSAVAFRKWLMKVKSVDPNNISFCADDSSLLGRTSGASATQISRAIFNLVQSGKNRTPELYVFFSGHGLRYEDHPAGEAVDIIVAADFVSPDVSGNECRKVHEIQRYLRTHLGPGEHFYFVDACRNLLKARDIRPGGLGLAIDRARTGDANPFLLFSTRSGSYAKVASGFGDSLLAGLKGTGKAKVRANGDAVVNFASLAEFVDEQLSNQEVAPKPGEGAGEILRIQPAPKYDCVIEVAGASSGDLFEVKLKTMSGIELGIDDFMTGASFQGKRGVLNGVPFDKYTLEVSPVSGAVDPASQVIELFADLSVSVTMKPPPRRSRGVVRALPGRAPSSKIDLGTVTVRTSPGARLQVRGLRTAQVSFEIPVTDQYSVTRRYAPGDYIFKMMAANGRTLRQRRLQVKSRGTQTLSLGPTSANRVSRALRSSFGRKSWDLDFSESLGKVTDQDLGVWLSILGASCIIGGTDEFAKLRQVPLARFEDEKPGASPLYVLAALKGTQGKLAVALSTGREPDWMACEKVRGVAGLQHLKIDTLPGPTLFTFCKPGGAPVTVVSHTLADRATLIVLSDEGKGELRIHQYLLPLHAQAKRHTGAVRHELKSNPLRTIKFLAQAQRRFFRSRRVAPEENTDSYGQWRNLLNAKWLDPMTATISAYELIRRGSAQEMNVVVRNLRRHFADIPDTEVLASLSGLQHDSPICAPLLLDGLLALKGYETLLPLPVENLDFSMAWTSWLGAVAQRPVGQRDTTAPRMRRWIRVPQGASLEVRVDDKDRSLAGAAATLTAHPGKQVSWGDLHTQSRAKKRRLDGSGSYYLRVEVVFARSASAEVEVKIRKPDGSIHGKPLRRKITGHPGQRFHVACQVQMSRD